MSTIETLMKRTVRSGDCLEWAGYVCGSGYRLVWHEGKNRSVHRVSFELHNMEVTQLTHSHHDRPRLANSLRRRGQWIDQRIIKTYRSHAA